MRQEEKREEHGPQTTERKDEDEHQGRLTNKAQELASKASKAHEQAAHGVELPASSLCSRARRMGAPGSHVQHSTGSTKRRGTAPL